MSRPVSFRIRTTAHREMVDITSQVREAVHELGVTDGTVLVHSMHTTAAITINENADPDVQIDLIAAFEALIPPIQFRHGEGNSDAHLLVSLIGPSVSIPVADGRPVLGTWQGIYLCDLDGPRIRTVTVAA